MKTCPMCNGRIIGRTDKKYCSSSCRSNYHNLTGRQTDQLFLRINRKLKRNREILAELLLNGITFVNHFTLIEKGFDFSYLTSTKVDAKGEQYSYCYDMAYMIIDEKSYLIFNNVGISKRKYQQSINGPWR